MKNYRPWDTDRTYLLPPSTRDWLPEDHLAWFILELVNELDLRAIEETIQEKDPRGMPPYSPRMMVALLLYAYATGTYSSRRIAKATWTDVAFRVLAGEQHPHFTTINQFRLDHLDSLAALFTQVLKLCHKAGMVDLGQVAIDGTKIQANASKHKAMSHDRMKETEKRLKAEVETLLARANETDRAEDQAFGADKDGTDVPEELRRRTTRLARIAAARAELEREAAAARKMEIEAQADHWREEAKAAATPDDEAKLTRRSNKRQKAAEALGVDIAVIPGVHDGLPFHTVQHDADGAPKPKAQRNFTDPESRIMAHNGTYMQGWNAQIAVDETNQIIVAQVVTNQAPDVEHLIPLNEQVHVNLGRYPTTMTADAGFWSDENGDYCAQNGIDAYISTRRRRHEQLPDDPPDPAPNPAARTTAGEKMEAKVTSEGGRKVYAKRKWTVEPVFGQVKEARRFRRFSLRGMRKVRGEFSLLCAVHNVLKLKKHRSK
jgi:transposase